MEYVYYRGNFSGERLGPSSYEVGDKDCSSNERGTPNLNPVTFYSGATLRELAQVIRDNTADLLGVPVPFRNLDYTATILRQRDDEGARENETYLIRPLTEEEMGEFSEVLSEF